MGRRILAVVLLATGLLLTSCQGEQKKEPEKVYAPPKLRSEAVRSSQELLRKERRDERVALKMTKKQVEDLQGKPESVDVISYPGQREVVEDWRYPTIENGCRQVLFTNGRATLLRECVGAANTSPATE